MGQVSMKRIDAKTCFCFLCNSCLSECPFLLVMVLFDKLYLFPGLFLKATWLNHMPPFVLVYFV